MSVPPGVAGPAASAMRELLASLPDDRQRIEGLQLLDRLIHEERACGGRLAHLAHVYPNLSMPSMHSMPNTPPLGFSGWGGNDQSLERPVSWARHPDEGKIGYGADMEALRLTSFNPLAVAGSTGPPVSTQPWMQQTSWGSNNAMSNQTHLKGGEDNQSAENSLGWAGIVKDLELEDEGTLGPVPPAVTESRILSFVVPTAPDSAVAPGLSTGKMGALPGQMAKQHAGALAPGHPRSADEGQKQPQESMAAPHHGVPHANAHGAGAVMPHASGPKFSLVVSQKDPAVPPAGAGPAESAPGSSGKGPWNAAAGEPLPPLQPTSNGTSAPPAIGVASTVVGSRVGSSGSVAVGGGPGVQGPLSAGAVRAGPSVAAIAQAQSTAPSAPGSAGAAPGVGNGPGKEMVVGGVLQGGGGSASPTVAGCVPSEGAGGVESMVSVVKKAAAAERRPAGYVKETPPPAVAITPPAPGAAAAVSGLMDRRYSFRARNKHAPGLIRSLYGYFDQAETCSWV